MKIANCPARQKVTIELEIEHKLLKTAERLGLNLSELLEESLLRLSSDSYIRTLAEEDVSPSVFQHLIDDYPVSTTGLRHCYHDK